MPPTFEQTGWSRIDISPPALDAVEADLVRLGVSAEPYDIKPNLAEFRSYVQRPEYAGDYRTYGGNQIHCLLEKALEHHLSLALANPQPGQVAVDVGSCKSVVPGILRKVYGVRCFEQDLEYPEGVHGDRIGSSADAIPLPDASVDFMMLHCTFEHFEGGADTGFVKECARLLKRNGITVVLPLYLNANYCNVTGETDTRLRKDISFDPDASFHCVIPEWRNRFGRHYSPHSLLERIISPANAAGMTPRLLRCRGWEEVDPRLWLRWVLILQQGA